MDQRVWLVAALALMAGCLGPEPLVDRTFELPPGQPAEINLSMAAGDTIRARWATDAQTMTWDVHQHGEDGVEILQQGNGTSGTIEHAAETAGDVSIYLEPTDQTTGTTLTIEVTGQAEVRSLIP